MSVKTTVDKIFKKVWEDHHITPEEFELNRKEKQEDYERWCKNFTDDDRERIKKACDLLARLFDSIDGDERESISEQFDAEYETLGWEHRKAVEYFRAECLVKKYKDKPAYTTRKIRDSYRFLAERVRKGY